MPWRGPRHPGEFPTLGYDVADWIEAHCVIPDGDRAGDPFVLTDEMLRFLCWHYRIRPESGGWWFPRGSQLVRPQKWGKGPFSAAIICAEGAPDGPVIFDGWDADGEPVGRPWATPWIQVTAMSEDQTDNVFRALVPMIELGSLAGDMPDTGVTRVNLPSGGVIEPVTASAMSRLGQRVTFVLQDEALALDTPVPTPTGWTTMGDLVAGDLVIGSDGRPTSVLVTTPPQHGRTCYRVTFADGESIVASDGHLWQTRVAGSVAKPRVRTTGEMVADGRRFRVPVAQPWDLPEADLPVDPYLLGLWLGDGSTGQPHITAAQHDIDELRATLAARGIHTTQQNVRDRAPRIAFSSSAGYQASHRPEVAKALQALPCYRMKHVPPVYFRASVRQRTDLLRGLMDSDGHVTVNGQCTFAGNDQLSANVLELLRTLGQSALRVWHADERSRVGGGWKVNFVPRGDLQPFALRRKAERVRPYKMGGAWVSITAIEPVESVPVRCIGVDAADHLFIAGAGCHVTHNTHSWLKKNGGVKLADNQRRNLAGMGGRWIETTNAWDPAEESVAQKTNESPIGVHVDFPPSIAGSFRNKRERRRVLRHAYGDSVKAPGKLGWVDLDRIDVEVEALLEHDPAQAERFFGNRVHAGEGAAFDPAKWAAAAVPTHVVADRELVVLGIDGARFDDAVAVVACEVATGHVWPVKIIERPEHAGDDYEHDFDEVDGAVAEVFDRFEVWRAYVDPQHIERLVERWQGRWTDKVVIEWFTNRPRQIAHAVKNFQVAVNAGDLTHDGDSMLARHVAQARKKPLEVKDEDGRPMWSLQKDRRGSPLKIDGAMAAVLAWEARCDAVSANATKKKRRRAAGF